MGALDGGEGGGRGVRNEVVDSAVSASSGIGSELNRNQSSFPLPPSPVSGFLNSFSIPLLR